MSVGTSCVQVGACRGHAPGAASCLSHPHAPLAGTAGEQAGTTRRLPGNPSPGRGAAAPASPDPEGSHLERGCCGDPPPPWKTWHSLGAGTPSAGVPHRVPGTRASGTGCTDLGPSSPPLSSPRHPGSVLPPSPSPAALPAPPASQPGTAREAAGPRARGALRMRRVPSSPRRDKRGCPCPHGPRQGKGGDTRLCPGSWRGIREMRRKGRARCRAASPPAHTEHLSALIIPCSM